MAELFERFPYLESDMLIIRKMEETDLDALAEITGNENVFRYIPPFLYKKSRGNLLTAIRTLGGREFDKKRKIDAGIYLRSEPGRLIGEAQMFDYKKRANQITIGYRLNEAYWHRGVATEAVRMMVQYLCGDMGVRALKAYVMPESVFSQRVLLKNRFRLEPDSVVGKDWGGKETAELLVFTYTA